MKRRRAGKVGGAMQLMKAGTQYATRDRAIEVPKDIDVIFDLLNNHAESLTEWETTFLVSCASQGKLTKKQHIRIARIHTHP